MANRISNGIESLVGDKSSKNVQLEQHEKSWGNIRSKLYSMLMAGGNRDECMKLCNQLDSMSMSSRHEFILSNWGRLYADRAMPLLQQLESIERVMLSVKD